MPRLTSVQQTHAAERSTLAEKAAEVKRRRALDVATATGTPAALVAEIIETYIARFGAPSAQPEEPPAGPTKPTPRMAAGMVVAIHRHLLAVRGLAGFLPPETAGKAEEALKAAEEALVAWEKVRSTLPDSEEEL